LWQAKAIASKKERGVLPNYEYGKRAFAHLISGDLARADADYLESARLRLLRPTDDMLPYGPDAPIGGFMF
jgi:hypothetical protein